MLVFVSAYAASLLLVGFSLHMPLFDRYLFLFVPAILVLVVTKETRSGYMPERRWRGALSLMLVLVYATVAVAATHDYLAWNRARWMATRTLMEAGVSPHQIDGGYEFNGWYLSDPNYQREPNKSYWWVDDDEYVIASLHRARSKDIESCSVLASGVGYSSPMRASSCYIAWTREITKLHARTDRRSGVDQRRDAGSREPRDDIREACRLVADRSEPTRRHSDAISPPDGAQLPRGQDWMPRLGGCLSARPSMARSTPPCRRDPHRGYSATLIAIDSHFSD